MGVRTPIQVGLSFNKTLTVICGTCIAIRKNTATNNHLSFNKTLTAVCGTCIAFRKTYSMDYLMIAISS